MRKGELNPESLQYLRDKFDHAEIQRSRLGTMLWTFTIHLGFVVIVPLLFRLLLTGHLRMGFEDLGELFIAGLGLLAVAGLSIRFWPCVRLCEEGTAKTFALAYLGQFTEGEWAHDLAEMTRSSWLTGLPVAAERRRLLNNWYEKQSLAFDRRLALLENSLGPLELFLSCFFGLVLLALPLFKHFSGLVGSP